VFIRVTAATERMNNVKEKESFSSTAQHRATSISLSHHKSHNPVMKKKEHDKGGRQTDTMITVDEERTVSK